MFLKSSLLVLAAAASQQSYCTSTLRSCEPNELAQNHDLKEQLKSIYRRSFEAVYKEHWDEEFAQESLKFCDSSLEKFAETSNWILITADSPTGLSGWALFHIKESQATLELICIDPACQRQGLGKKLVFAIKDLCPAITRIYVATFKINKFSPKFYESLGFKKTNFMPPEYEAIATKLQGYELELPSIQLPA